MFKICSKCNQNKSLEEFYSDKSKKDGRYTICVDCSRPNANKKKRFRQEENERVKNGIKTCSKCEKIKSLDQFQRANKKRYGLAAFCADCNSVERKEYYKNNINKEKVLQKKWNESNPDKIYAAHLKARYGLKWDEYNKLLSQHNNKCATCNSDKKLCVDHNHMTGKVRGILCSFCNMALGFAKDDPRILQNLINYLSKHSIFQQEEILDKNPIDRYFYSEINL